MGNIIKFFFAQPNVWAPILVLIIGLLSRSTYKQGGVSDVSEKMLSWYFLLCVGYIGLWGGIAHVFFGDFTAKTIGWATSPFQTEVGIANFAYAVMGVYAFKVKAFQARVAVLLGFSVWLIGDGIGHIYQLVHLHDTAFDNAGPMLYTDLLLPVMGWVLLFLSRRRDSN